MTDKKSISETFLKEEKERKESLSGLDISKLDYEIDLISDPKIKKFVRFLLKNAPAFWIAPASTTQGLHPEDEECSGGLVLHTKRVVKIIVLLSSSLDIVSSVDIDCLIAAALLHDISKFVTDEETQQIVLDPMHPYTVDKYVEWSISECLSNGKAYEDTTIEIDRDAIELILRLIRCSHGVWSQIPETIPSSPLEKALHEADLIASNIHLLYSDTERL